MSNINNFNYKQCVNRGKELLKEIKVLRYDICELTLRVCEIKIGGHLKGSPAYSMKRFAEDIGMSVNTLRKWMEQHRNIVVKLPEKPKAEDYKIIRQVMKEVTSKSSTKEVVKSFNKFKSFTKEDYRMLDAIKFAKTIRHTLESTALPLVDKEDVKALSDLVGQCKNILDKHNKNVVLIKNCDIINKEVNKGKSNGIQ